MIRSRNVLLLTLGTTVACAKLLRHSANAAWKPHELPEEGNRFRSQTVKDLQSFILSSPGGSASLVFIGDSSVRGLVESVLNLTSSTHVYQGSHLSQGGSEWQDPTLERDLENGATLRWATAVANAKTAYGFFESTSCGLRGAIETHYYDQPLEGLVLHYWAFQPEINEACWKPCMAEMVQALQPSAVVWNIGLHLLSTRYDAKNCEMDHGKVPGKANCGNYEELVTEGLGQLSSVTPKLVWRTTNWACWDKFVSKPDWHDLATRDELEEACRNECPEGPVAAGENCYDQLLDTRGTRLQYDRSMRAINNVKWKKNSTVQVLDAFTKTRDNCDETPDGVHYRNLDFELARDLASLLAA